MAKIVDIMFLPSAGDISQQVVNQYPGQIRFATDALPLEDFDRAWKAIQILKNRNLLMAPEVWLAEGRLHIQIEKLAAKIRKRVVRANKQ